VALAKDRQRDVFGEYSVIGACFSPSTLVHCRELSFYKCSSHPSAGTETTGQFGTAVMKGVPHPTPQTKQKWR
jgi:hypothetical protein